jgi:MFS family permease
VLALFASFIFFLVIFITVELRTEQPMIDLRLFKNFIFTTSLLTGFLVFVSLSGTILLMPFFLENVLGYSPNQVGLLLAVVPISLGIVAPLAGSLSDRVGSRPITVVGLLLLLTGFVAVSTISSETTASGYILRFLPVGLGIGIFQSPNNSAIMGTAPQNRLGIVSGMLAVTRTLGQTTGIAILGAIWSSRVISYAGGQVSGGATQAAPVYQVAGLQDTFQFVIIVVIFALGLGIWALVRSRRQTQQDGAAAPAPTSSLD